MTRYDPSIIRHFADMLYARARAIVLTYTIVGFLLGGATGAGAAGLLFIMLATFGGARSNAAFVVLMVAGSAGAVCAILGAIVGRNAGLAKAFGLKLQAQTALCQVQIEQNTRPPEDKLGRSAQHDLPAVS